MLLDQEEYIRFVIWYVAGSRAAPNYAQAAIEPAILTRCTITPKRSIIWGRPGANKDSGYSFGEA